MLGSIFNVKYLATNILNICGRCSQIPLIPRGCCDFLSSHDLKAKGCVYDDVARALLIVKWLGVVNQKGLVIIQFSISIWSQPLLMLPVLRYPI